MIQRQLCLGLDFYYFISHATFPVYANLEHLAIVLVLLKTSFLLRTQLLLCIFTFLNHYLSDYFQKCLGRNHQD